MKFSINLEPPQDVLDGRDLVKLINLWLEQQRLRPDVSEHTAGCYADKLRYFVEWWQDVGPWCDWELSKEKLTQFGEWLCTVRSQYGRPLEFNSRKVVLKRLKQCFRWAYRREYLPCDITPWVPTALGSAPLRVRASLDQLAALMQAAGDSRSAVRDRALVAIFIGTGVRRAEAVGIDVADVRLNADQSGTIIVRRAKRVKGRAVQSRIVAVDRWTGQHLAALLDTYPDLPGPLFRSRGRRLSDAGAYLVVKGAIRRAGLDAIIQGPHDLRRNFATWFSKSHRGELYGRLLSRQLGHSGFAMTDHYILHDADDLVEVIRSPLAEAD